MYRDHDRIDSDRPDYGHHDGHGYSGAGSISHGGGSTGDFDGFNGLVCEVRSGENGGGFTCRRG